MSMWSRTLVYLGLREEPDDAAQWAVIEDAEQVEDVIVTPPSGSSTLRPDAPSPARPAAPPAPPRRAARSPPRPAAATSGRCTAAPSPPAVV